MNYLCDKLCEGSQPKLPPKKAYQIVPFYTNYKHSVRGDHVPSKNNIFKLVHIMHILTHSDLSLFLIRPASYPHPSKGYSLLFMLPINTLGTTTDIHETSIYTVSQKVTMLHFLLTISEVNDQTSRLVLQLVLSSRCHGKIYAGSPF